MIIVIDIFAFILIHFTHQKQSKNNLTLHNCNVTLICLCKFVGVSYCIRLPDLFVTNVHNITLYNSMWEVGTWFPYVNTIIAHV